LGHNSSSLAELRKAASREGRAQTATKLHQHLIDESSKLAAIRTKDLYAYLSNVLDLGEAMRLAQFSTHIYIKLLDLYQVSPSVTALSTEQLWETFGDSSLAAWGIPKVC
jgi:hypothetical protein